MKPRKRREIKLLFGRQRGRTVAMRDIIVKAPVMECTAELFGKVLRADGSVEDLGLLSTRVVTDAFVALIVNSMVDSATYNIGGFIYHESGTGGATAESAADTALVTPVESRVAGTATAYAANVYETVATITYTAAYTIDEHGVFNAATGGTLLDRSTFTGIAVNANDSIQFTYRITFNSGG